MEADRYIEDCRELSVTARAMIALLVLEAFCRRSQIESKEVEGLLSYLWQWPRVQFDHWEKNRPWLVDAVLSSELPPALREHVESRGAGVRGFEIMLEGPVRILWGNFWGAAEDFQSLEVLRGVVSAGCVDRFPALTPFRFSRFSECSGWGLEVRERDHEFWRSLRCLR